MSSLVSRVAARYKTAVDVRRLNLAWYTFKEWNLSGPISTLDILSKAFNSKPLGDKARKILDIDSRLKRLDKEYTPRFKALISDPSDLPNLRKELERELRLVWVLLQRYNFTADDIYSDIDDSPITKVLGNFDRDSLINRIELFPEGLPEEEDLDWLKSLNFSQQQRALDQVHSYIPDLTPSDGDWGSFTRFKEWVHNLPSNYDEWEDALPSNFEEISTDVVETKVGQDVSKYFDDSKSIFEYIQGDIDNLSNDLGI
jgi:hypothetical protein